MTAPKRPRDTNQLAKMVVDIASGGNVADDNRAPSIKAADGAKGGTARARNLTAEQRAEGARLAAQARWRRKTP